MWKRRGDVAAQSRAMKSSGVNLTVGVPSAQSRLQNEADAPVGL
jgi:hypothetical protein